MSIFTDIWGSLVLQTAGRGMDVAKALSLRRSAREGVIYRPSRAYKSRLALEASRLAIREAMNTIENLYSDYLRRVQKEQRKVTFDDQMRRNRTLIENQLLMVDEELGMIKDADSGQYIYATDQYGTLIPEALILSYKGDEKIEMPRYSGYPVDSAGNQRVGAERRKNVSDHRFSEKLSTFLVCHIDLAPEVSVSSDKNIVLTTVQDRDFSRKELVSGGDLIFKVNGIIQCDQPGVYPKAAVQRFMKTMQYGGIVDVHHFMFKYLGVTRVLIQDWSLDHPDCKNVQPYSFSCVAVEPDEEIQIKDTIKALDNELAQAPELDGWKKILVNDQFAKVTQNLTSSLLNSSITELTELTSGRI